jgi:hypothetical protein
MGAQPGAAGSARGSVRPPRSTSSGQTVARPLRHRRPPGPSGPRTPRAGAKLARRACRCGPPGPARAPAPRGAAHGRRTGRPAAVCDPAPAPACSRADTLGIGPWSAAAARPQNADRQYPGTACPAGRRLGLPVARPGQPAAPTASGNAPARAPGHQLASPGPALPTGSSAHGPRHTCPPGRGRHRLRMACLDVDHGPAGARPSCRRKLTRRMAPAAVEVSHTSGRGAAPGW